MQYAWHNSTLIGKVIVLTNTKVPASECKVLREEYSGPDFGKGLDRIRQWYGTLAKVCELRPGEYFATPPSQTAFLYDDECRFTRLHDGAYVDGFFKNVEGNTSTNNSSVWRITKEQSVEMVTAYCRKLIEQV